MAKDMDEFLSGAAPDPEPIAEPVVDAAQPEPAPAPEPKPEPVAETPAADDEPVAEDVAGLRQALQAERSKRRDYKGERDKLEGELAALKAQLEAAAKAPPPPPAVPEPVAERAPPMPIPNPVEDPQGYHNYIEMKRISDKLDMSEAMLRGQIGDDADVDAKVSAFKKMADANPALQAELLRQKHPYRFAYDYVKRTEAMAEIGTDPGAYRSKLEAEIRAKIEAEMTAGLPVAQTRPAPDVVLPTSLGTARSAAPRMQSVPEAPEFEDIFKPRKRA